MTQKTTSTATEPKVPSQSKSWKMEIPSLTTKPKNAIKKTFNIIYVLACCVILYKVGETLYKKKVVMDLTKKESACPALLSITRSARDTLIVMKAEPLCNEYVLVNLE